jgi:hypothetical protein
MSTNNHPEASFSVLLMSIASSAVMAMGLAPDPQSGQTSVDKTMAKFNIDLLLILKDKTLGRLTQDEQNFIDAIISDLQIKFVSISKA